MTPQKRLFIYSKNGTQHCIEEFTRNLLWTTLVASFVELDHDTFLHPAKQVSPA